MSTKYLTDSLLRKLAHKRQSKRLLQMPVEVIVWDQLFYGDVAEWSPRAGVWFPS
jgi:hypothetical protein